MGRLICLVAAAAAFAVWPLVPAPAQTVTGAGSTLAHPVLAEWSRAYQRSQADADFQPVGAGLDYEPVGSQAGVMRVKDGAVDFGATDVPLSAEELRRFSLAQFPVVVGGVVVAVTADGVAPGRLRLTGEVLADIYLGRVQTWSDPAVRALNPDLVLPDAPIAVVRRSDGSGTSATFTGFLSEASPAWRDRVGSGLLVAWPAGSGAKGNDGMAEALKRTRNAVGYLDFAQARKAGLGHALIRNRAGAFVAPGVEGFRAAAQAAGWGSTAGFDAPLTDAPGEASYPIVAATYVVLPKRPDTLHRSRAVVSLFRWSLDHGAQAAAELGYVPLPRGLVERIKEHWAANF